MPISAIGEAMCRLNHIEGARGVAALWILLCHVSIWIYAPDATEENLSANTRMTANTTTYKTTYVRSNMAEEIVLAVLENGYSSLGLFTAISGFVSEYSVGTDGASCSLGSFAKRVMRVAPVAWLGMWLDAVLVAFGPSNGRYVTSPVAVDNPWHVLSCFFFFDDFWSMAKALTAAPNTLGQYDRPMCPDVCEGASNLKSLLSTVLRLTLGSISPYRIRNGTLTHCCCVGCSSLRCTWLWLGHSGMIASDSGTSVGR